MLTLSGGALPEATVSGCSKDNEENLLGKNFVVNVSAAAVTRINYFG
jgi:hypothetical protein